MTARKNFKRLVRDEARKHGMSYAASRQRLLDKRMEAHDMTKETDSDAPRDIPGWLVTDRDAVNFEAFLLDEETGPGGGRVARLAARAGTEGGQGAIFQLFGSEKYRGKRVRYSAALRTAGARNAGLCLRVDAKAGGKSLAFDNMLDRTVQGDTDWARYESVLDVADDAGDIGLGIVYGGAQYVDVADMQFEVVGTDVPVTDMYLTKPTEPVNLDLQPDP